ncbi:terminase large subunit [Sporosarcina highlanderae]|uniref:Terminase large subunit n=1 Tax=Sporosarcina highlanderae TaxID=3035916 RepID=A0ABT8JVC7_9BACL|nr:terminase large subunit [Sporosarcina highlanderae]MDN4609131.1 terminase large subunit [Sporosarcina highlanderae]
MNKEFKNYDIVFEYANSVIEKRKVANKETIQMCKRFFRDLKNPRYEFNPKDAEFVIQIIEKTFVHQKGEDMEGYPLRGKPFLLQPWQKFVVYSILGFFHKGTILRKYKEAFMMLPRKQGKTPFMSALSWGLGLLERKSGAEIVIVGAQLKQAMQSFNFLLYNLKNMGEEKSFRILDNNQEHSISGELGNGYMRIETIAGNSDRMDSLNTLIQILDELHLYKSASQYNTIKESGKAYRNSLCIGITTAGDNMNSFCYNRMVYCQKILDGTVKDEQYFVFIAKADQDENGDVDYTNPIEHEKANPNYNVSVSGDELMNDAMQAQGDPQQRKSFLAKSLNIYTSAMRAYFNPDEFKTSNDLVEEKLKLSGLSLGDKLKALSKLPIDWFGGADLSKRHDLTATGLYGSYKDIDIVIPHAFFPLVAAHEKADVDNIPLFGWKDDGWLTMTNSPIVEYQEVVKWFMKMKKRNFKIKQTGFDRKFGREFFLTMKKEGFRIEDTPQLFYLKSEGFRRIETKAKEGNFYYLGSEAFLYCLQNVRAIEQTDDAIKYEKVLETQRIDVFDAAVFSCMQMLKNMEKSTSATKWLNS